MGRRLVMSQDTGLASMGATIMGMIPFRVRTVQTYPRLGDLTENFASTRIAIEKAAADGTDLVVFPELSLTGYHLRDIVPSVSLTPGHPILKSLEELSREIAIVVGFVEE